jgi:hypothetical protein
MSGVSGAKSLHGGAQQSKGCGVVRSARVGGGLRSRADAPDCLSRHGHASSPDFDPHPWVLPMSRSAGFPSYSGCCSPPGACETGWYARRPARRSPCAWHTAPCASGWPRAAQHAPRRVPAEPLARTRTSQTPRVRSHRYVGSDLRGGLARPPPFQRGAGPALRPSSPAAPVATPPARHGAPSRPSSGSPTSRRRSRRSSRRALLTRYGGASGSVLRSFGSSFVRLRVHRSGSRASDWSVSLARSAAYSWAVRRSRPPRPGPWIGPSLALLVEVWGLVARGVVNGWSSLVAAAADCSPGQGRRGPPDRPPGPRGTAPTPGSSRRHPSVMACRSAARTGLRHICIRQVQEG